MRRARCARRSPDDRGTTNGTGPPERPTADAAREWGVVQIRRTMYVAGIDRRSYAELAAPVPAWLLSAGYLKNLPLWLLPHLSTHRILWDPGVFSKVPRRQIALAEYEAFMAYHHCPGMRWLSYDAIGDPKQTWKNLQRLRADGFDVVPVYHEGMPVDVLHEPDVAIGGLVPLTEGERRRFLDWVYGGVKPEGDIHLLGMHDPDLFRRYPAQAGDATSWLRSARFKEGPSPTDLLRSYGDVEIPYCAQARLAV